MKKLAPPLALTNPGVLLDGIPPGTSKGDVMTGLELDRTAAACAWLLPLAEASERLGNPPEVAAWLRRMLLIFEQELTTRRQ